VRTFRLLPVSLISQVFKVLLPKAGSQMEGYLFKRDESPGEVPVKLVKGNQKESQGNNSARKGQLVSIFGGNLLYAEAKIVRSFK
jgi:hypothetical protein